MAEAVTVFVGMTHYRFIKEKLGVYEIFEEYMENEKKAYRAEKIFLHSRFYFNVKNVKQTNSNFSPYFHPGHCSDQAGKEGQVQLLCVSDLSK